MIQKITIDLKSERKSREESELEFERSKRQFEEMEIKCNIYQEEKDHMREMVKIEFEQKLSDFTDVKNENEQLKSQIETLKSEGEKTKLEHEENAQNLNKQIENLKRELEENKKVIQQLRFDEKKRAQGLMEAVKLFISPENVVSNDQENIKNENNAD